MKLTKESFVAKLIIGVAAIGGLSVAAHHFFGWWGVLVIAGLVLRDKL